MIQQTEGTGKKVADPEVSSCPNHEGLGLSIQSSGKEINILSEKAAALFLLSLRLSNIIPSVSIRIDVTL